MWRKAVVPHSLLLPILLLTGSHNLLNYAIICLVDTEKRIITTPRKYPKNTAFPGNLGSLITMIKVLFICHGNMPKWYGNVNIHGMMRWTLWENTPFLHLLISLKAEHSYDLNILFKNTSIKRCVFLLLFESRGELDAKNQITR